MSPEQSWQGWCSSQERELRDRDSDRASGRAVARATCRHSCPLRSLLTPEPFGGDQLKDTEPCPNPPRLPKDTGDIPNPGTDSMCVLRV